MDLGKILKDTTDQQNHARWTGSSYALNDLADHMRIFLKTEGCTNKSFAEDVVTHVGEEIKRYKELILTTDVGKKMKDLENIK